MANNPKLWTDILNSFDMADVGMIAGGAVRDFFLGGAVRDIDVFLRRPNRNLTDIVRPDIDNNRFQFMGTLAGDNAYDTPMNPMIISNWTYRETPTDVYRVQVMQLTQTWPGDYYWDSFDLTTSMAQFSVNSGLTAAPEFCKSINDSEIKLRHRANEVTPEAYNRTLARATDLQQRYADRNFRIVTI